MVQPSGTVALLFTDIESSMRLWSADTSAMAASLEAHDALLEAGIEAADGYIFTRAGDSYAAAFATVDEAIAVAERCQRDLDGLEWPGPTLRVRMGLHVGEVQTRDGDYFGPAVNLAARVCDAGHGGQILVTAEVAALGSQSDRAASLGVFHLRGSAGPVELLLTGCAFEVATAAAAPASAAATA